MTYKFVEGVGKPGDWVAYCQICAKKVWALDMTKLGVYTGRGGLRVCPDCVDVTDYGLVPYVPRAEKNVPFISYLLPNVVDTDAPMDYVDGNPLYTSPAQNKINSTNPDNDNPPSSNNQAI